MKATRWFSSRFFLLLTTFVLVTWTIFEWRKKVAIQATKLTRLDSLNRSPTVNGWRRNRKTNLQEKDFFSSFSPSWSFFLGCVIIIFILRFLKPQNITDRNGLAKERFSRWQKHSWSDRERTGKIFFDLFCRFCGVKWSSSLTVHHAVILDFSRKISNFIARIFNKTKILE